MERVDTRGEHVRTRGVGGDGPVRRPRSLRAAATATALFLGLLAAAVVPSVAAAESLPPTGAGSTAGPGATGSAAGTTTSDPSPTPVPLDLLTPATGRPTTAPPAAPPPPSGRPPVAPTIADPGDVTTGTVRFHGAGTPGHRLEVGSRPTGTTCTATVAQGGTWACFAAVRSGPQQVFVVQDRTAPALGSAAAPASDVIVPPTVAAGRVTSGPVSGTGYPGATVVLSVSGSTADRTVTVARDGRWTLSLVGAGAPGRRGDARVSVTATQTASTAAGFRSDLRSAASAPVTVTLDRTPPAAPRITTPTAGARVAARPVTVAGRGEAGAVLTVYADRAPVCRATVGTDGAWSCSTAGSVLRAGTRDLTATQQDAAGNFSASSTTVSVRVAPPPSADTPPGDPGRTDGALPTSDGPGSTGVPGAPVPGHGHDAGPSGGASGGSGAGSAGGEGPRGTGGTGGTGTGGASGATGTGPGGGAWSGPAGDWTAATTYDAAVPTIQASFSWRIVMIATAVAAGFLVLVAAPLALVAGGRARVRSSGLLGRNRPREERRRGEDLLPTWASIAVAVVVVALCVVLGVGVSLEARYLRLAVAVLLGAAVLTSTTVLTARWSAGAQRHLVGFRVSPWLVLAALVACGVTRAFDLSPAVVVGAVLVPVGRPDLGTGALRLGADVVTGVRSVTYRAVAFLVVAAAGWTLHSLTPGTGFWTAMVSEFAITLCVGGLGAVVAALVPVAGSTGSALLAASRGRYVAIALVAVALTAAVYSGPGGTHVSPVALVAVGVVCVVGAAVAHVVLRQRARARGA